MNTGFTSAATPKGFGQWLVTAPDESGKIRKQGLEQLRGQEKVLAYINKQADRVVAQLEFNNQTEAKNRADNFKLKQDALNEQIRANKAKEQQASLDGEQRLAIAGDYDTRAAAVGAG